MVRSCKTVIIKNDFKLLIVFRFFFPDTLYYINFKITRDLV